MFYNTKVISLGIHYSRRTQKNMFHNIFIDLYQEKKNSCNRNVIKREFDIILE